MVLHQHLVILSIGGQRFRITNERAQNALRIDIEGSR